MSKKSFWGIGCTLGSGLIGFFADRLGNFAGSALFALGVALVVVSVLGVTRTDDQAKE